MPPVVEIGGALSYRRRLRGREKEIAEGGECRPDCVWHSIYVERREWPPVLERTEFTQGPAPMMTMIEHYRQRREKVWANYHCENGHWKYKSPYAIDVIWHRWEVRTEVF